MTRKPGVGGEVVWLELDGSGEAIGTPVPISAGQKGGTGPTLIATGGGYAIAWCDTPEGNQEVYLAQIAAGGSVSPKTRISNDATSSTGPSLTRGSTGYGVAWLDDQTDTTGEVFFASACTGD